MSPYLAEFIGTTLLVLFGNGVVANVLLARTKGNNAGWIVITAGWGLAVFIGAFCSAPFSGAHLNPAVTVAMAMAGKLEMAKVAGYIGAQMLGGIIGGALVFFYYREHFKVSDDGDAKLACFCTAPNIRNIPQSFFCEVIGTFCLILPIFLMTDAKFKWPVGVEATASDVVLGLGSLGLIPVAMLVFAIGLSLGGTTGYAINPARDLGPRIAHALLPVPGKRDSDWSYAWVPVVGPLVGAMLAAGVQALLQQ
ncbi:MAG TPA: MIP/aquaporin family protein [Chthoniobacteraceae bacterium]|nr:MIP/aquaporin family protein [Chthoniobacteraceae bacterium]